MTHPLVTDSSLFAAIPELLSSTSTPAICMLSVGIQDGTWCLLEMEQN